MAPSPENDTAPKAPDKGEIHNKTEVGTPLQQKQNNSAVVAGDTKEPVQSLDDTELKNLLDEAITYKSPKDRKGKSELFNDLLTKAEDDLRNARATSASGPEYVRYYNTTATRRHRNKRRQNSVSENLIHGGSLNNLSKEELYEATTHLQRPKKTVSARQKEGGSLPCNVNVGCSYDRQFFEGYRRNEQQKPLINMETNRIYEVDTMKKMDHGAKIPEKYTTKANLHLGPACKIEEPITFTNLERTLSGFERENKIVKSEFQLENHTPHLILTSSNVQQNKRPLYWQAKVDENCNSVENKKKGKRKGVVDKNVTVLEASKVSGHRSDIINDVDKLVDYIDGNEDHSTGKSKAGTQKSHKLNDNNVFDEGNTKGNSKKQKTRSKASAGGKTSNLKKSNSLEEISTTKLEDFEYTQDEGGTKVPLRPTKSNVDRPRERRSWGNSEMQLTSLYTNTSVENLETADFRVVTKKKKSKKQRRSSLNSRRQSSGEARAEDDFNRVPSPEPRKKSAASVPHSEKSNDSSDAESVHSLPVDRERHVVLLDHLECNYNSSGKTNTSGEDNILEDVDALGVPISYADIAKTSNAVEKVKYNNKSCEKKRTDQKQEKSVCAETNTDFVPPIHDATPAEQPEKVKVKSVNSPVVSTTPGIVSQGVQTSPQPLSVAASPTEKIPCSTEKVHFSQDPVTDNTYNNYVQNFPPIAPKERSPISGEKHSRNSVENSYHNSWPTVNHHGRNGNEQLPLSSKSINSTNQKVTKTITCTNNIKNAKSPETCTAVVSAPLPIIRPNPNFIFGNVNLCIQAENICENQVNPNGNNIIPPTSNFYSHQLPPNIPDVRTIEKMHFKHLQYQHRNHVLPPSNGQYVVVSQPGHYVTVPQIHVPRHIYSEAPNAHVHHQNPEKNQQASNESRPTINNSTKCDKVCNDHDRTSTGRPAVVILSGADKEVSGLTFGFDINEQLLSGDICSDFVGGFVPPKVDHSSKFNHEQIVDFISATWENIVSGREGPVTYYSDDL